MPIAFRLTRTPAPHPGRIFRESQRITQICARAQRRYASNVGGAPRPNSAHAQWYTEVLPAMFPVALLGSAVYLALQLAQTQLSQEKYLDEATFRIQTLEAEIDQLRQANLRYPLANHSSSVTNSQKSQWKLWGQHRAS